MSKDEVKSLKAGDRIKEKSTGREGCIWRTPSKHYDYEAEIQFDDGDFIYQNCVTDYFEILNDEDGE